MPERPFPFPMPFGWFSVGRVDELPPEPVARLRYFGQELVLWQDGSTRHLVHAACPHLGAHLGVGGRVEDGCLVCPFHGWSFDGDGANAAVPYADRPNRRARLRTFPTVERNRHLLAWYHPDPAVPPGFEVPDGLGVEHEEALRLDWRVQAAWQEIAENSVDMAHFRFVHGLERISEIGDLVLDGPYRQVRSTQLFNSDRGSFEGKLESNSYGPGVGTVHFDLVGRVTLVSTVTPVDESSVDVRFTFYHSGDATAAKIAPPFAAEVQRQFEQDIPIWESKFYLDRPALAPIEKPITVFRRWAAQFYAGEPGAAVRATARPATRR